MNTQILSARVRFIPRRLDPPLRISSGTISEISEARASVTVRVEGREAEGHGAMHPSDLWAWPEPSLDHDARDRILRSLCEAIAGSLPELGGPPAHPLELGLRLHHAACEIRIPENPSPLARAMCASPFDAALHDAAGRALGRSAFDLYREPHPIPSADRMFPKGGAAAAVARTLRPTPERAFDAWLVVGPHDSPERDVAPWIRERGYRAFKLKVQARDPAEDALFTAELFRAARALGADRPRLTADPNGAYPGPDAAREYLERLRDLDPEAFAAFEYLEQPTGRDIAGSGWDWRPVARLKPLLLDEGLTGFEILEEAVAQGWSGLALKTCKGHSFALVAAAWARERGLALALQDLTNPGLALLHAALFAAHVSTINGVELNSPQFTPDANAEWLPRLQPLFAPSDGTHRLPDAAPVGLGSDL